MAELKASELKYGIPYTTKVGGLYFTATQIETPASAEYVEGGIELNLTKLGLPDEGVAGAEHSVAGETTAGETATTTQDPILAWCTPLQTAKTAGEEKTQVAVMFPAGVTQIKGKLFIRIYSQETAGIGKPMLEPKTATKAAISLCATTVFVLGK